MYRTYYKLARARFVFLPEDDCSICNGKADEVFQRILVWENERWRLSMSTLKAVKGFCYLEPKRHIRYITELDGKEAQEFGVVLSMTSNALKKAARSKLVYIYIYGDHIPHLHVHLAPHNPGDIFVDDVVKKSISLREDLLSSREIKTLSKGITKHLSI